MPRGEKVGIKLQHVCGIAAPHQAFSGRRRLAIVQRLAADAVRGAVEARTGSVGVHGDRLWHEPSTVLHGGPHFLIAGPSERCLLEGPGRVMPIIGDGIAPWSGGPPNGRKVRCIAST